MFSSSHPLSAIKSVSKDDELINPISSDVCPNVDNEDVS